VLADAMHAAGHRVTVLGTGYDGGPHDRPYPVAACPPDRPEDAIAQAIRHDPPDVLFTIGDPWMFEFFQDVPGLGASGPVTWLAYFPVDGYPLPKPWAAWAAAVDVPVVFSTFTEKLIADATGRRPLLIPHGVDTVTFAPADKALAKARVGVPDRFVVGTVAANQQRKNLPALIKAFAAFAAGKPDATLYLHTQIAGYWDVQELVARFGVEDQTRATLNLDPQRGFPDATMATVYNAFDVFVLPTMAEGFGLPILESQSCGVPALATDFSACPDLLPEPIQRLRVKDTIIMARNFEQAIVDEADLAAKLDLLYRDRDVLARLGARGRQFALGYDWLTICRRFTDLIASLPPKPNAFRPRFVEV
jgi:glycosyltransferase involved in cell wall biosynthesis